MREIKFRAWDNVHTSLGCRMVYHGYDHNLKTIADFWQWINNHDKMPVMQFTGLKDKDGKDIYEGDILLSQEYSDKSHSRKCKYKRFRVRVCWDEKEARFYTSFIDKEDLYKYRYGQWGDFFDCEVIGNIHENTELLESTK